MDECMEIDGLKFWIKDRTPSLVNSDAEEGHSSPCFGLLQQTLLPRRSQFPVIICGVVQDFKWLGDPEDAKGIGEGVEGVDLLGLNSGDAERGWKVADARS